jgi:hypothetical protein
MSPRGLLSPGIRFTVSARAVGGLEARGKTEVIACCSSQLSHLFFFDLK